MEIVPNDSYIMETGTSNQTLSNLTVANVTDPTSSIGLTLAELWIQLIVFYIILCGIVSLIGNILMAVGVIRSKKLRSRFFIVVCALLVSRVLTCFQLLVIGIFRSLWALGLAGLYMTRLQCQLIHFNLYYSTLMEMALLLVLVVERIAAIVAYKYYRHLTSRQAVIVCVVASALSVLAKLLPWYIETDFNEIVRCVNVNSASYTSDSIIAQNMDLVVALLVLILYLGLILYLRCYLLPAMKKSSNGDQPLMASMMRQVNLIPLLRRLVLIHCGFAMTAKICLAVATILSHAEDAYRVTAYGGMLITVDLFVNVVVLLTTNKDLREATLALVGKVPVVPANTGYSTQAVRNGKAVPSAGVITLKKEPEAIPMVE